jgi:hypothetical protein
MSRALLVALFLAIGFSSSLLDPPLARARGDLVLDHDICTLKLGPELVYFAGYQPNSSHRRFCEDAPDVGQTIFVFDFGAPELREMKAGFRILRLQHDDEDLAESAAIEAATAAYLAPQVYPKGTFSFEHVFAEPGDFLGLVTVEGAHGEQWTSRFPFSVGKNRFEFSPYHLLAAAGVLAVALFVVEMVRSRRGPRARG